MDHRPAGCQGGRGDREPNKAFDRMKTTDNLFQEAVRGFLAGDFSRLAPQFENPPDGSPCSIIKWYEGGLFAHEPRALEEAFTCACFLGCTRVVEYLLVTGVNASGGAGTGLDALHWAANRGQLEVVRLLIRHKAPLERRSMYGGTVLSSAVWSAINEPKADHLKIIEALINAGARSGEVSYPTGNKRVDEVLRCRGPAT